MSGGHPKKRSSHPPFTAPEPTTAWRTVSAGLTYLAIYSWLSRNWLASAGHSSGVGINAADEPLVAWILGWVRSSLFTNPAQLFDAPINYPAPLQLAASEHFLSTQLLFSPLFWLTGKNLLAANLSLFLTYPIAALVMYSFLCAVGISQFPAFALGLAFSLGPFQVPANLHLLQSLNLYMPLVALALVRLREVPKANQCAVLACCSILAALSSYYTAVITAIAALVWGAQELLRPGPQRLRYLILAAVGAGAAATCLSMVSLPYFEYRAVAEVGTFTASELTTVQSINETIHNKATQWMHTDLLLVVAAVALLAGPTASRRCALVALILLGATPLFVKVLEIPGLEFFRYPFRFAVLTGFGAALAAAAGLESLRSRGGKRVAAVVSAALAIFVLLDRGRTMVGAETTRFIDAPEGLVHRIRDVTDRYGKGPLLELPLLGPLEDHGRIKGGTEARSMLLALEHELPLIAGHSGYLPVHRNAIGPFLGAESEQAIQHLVDATGLRWILVRPAQDWPPKMARSRDRILSLSTITRRLSYEGWQLLEVQVRPADQRWIESIRSGPKQGETIFGTPLQPLVATPDGGSVELGKLPRAVAGKSIRLTMRIENHGREIWPAATSPIEPSSPFEVRAFVIWLRPGHLDSAADRIASRTEIPLRWDLRPGAALSRVARVATPSLPGRYELRVVIAQGDGLGSGSPVLAVTERFVEVGLRRPRASAK